MKKIYCLFLLLTACSFTPHTGQDLIGKDKKAVERQFGKPVVSRTESPNQIWSFRIDDCSLLIYFNQDGIVQYVDYSGRCH